MDLSKVVWKTKLQNGLYLWEMTSGCYSNIRYTIYAPNGDVIAKNVSELETDIEELCRLHSIKTTKQPRYQSGNNNEL